MKEWLIGAFRFYLKYMMVGCYAALGAAVASLIYAVVSISKHK